MKKPKFTPGYACQIDSTSLDISVVPNPSAKGHIGRVFCTLVVDNFSRNIVGIHVDIMEGGKDLRRENYSSAVAAVRSLLPEAGRSV